MTDDEIRAALRNDEAQTLAHALVKGFVGGVAIALIAALAVAVWVLS